MNRKKKMAVLMCLILVSSMVLTTAAVSAKKPPKPPPEPEPTPEGTLYILYPDDGVNWVWSMDADGSNMAKDHQWGGGTLSRSQHGGHWWYIGWKAVGGTYPDGEPRWHIYAHRDDGLMEVQLTTDGNMEMNYLSIEPCWGHDDSYISWSAMIWDVDVSGNDEVREAGIYSASVTWDANGDMTGLGTIDRIYTSGHYSSPNGRKWVYAREHMDWSPDGTKMVFLWYDEVEGAISMVVYDESSSTTTDLVVGGWPRWSHDGNYIAYTRSYSLYIIKTDGTGETKLLSGGSKGNTRTSVHYWDWSLDSKYLSFRLVTTNTRKIGTGDSDIYIVNLSGTKTCLTSSLNDGSKGNVGWR